MGKITACEIYCSCHSCLSQSVLFVRLYKCNSRHFIDLSDFICWNCYFHYPLLWVSNVFAGNVVHGTKTSFKYEGTVPYMNSDKTAFPVGSITSATTWSTFGTGITCNAVTSLGSTYTTTAVNMAANDTGIMFRRMQDTGPSFATGTNTTSPLTTSQPPSTSAPTDCPVYCYIG